MLKTGLVALDKVIMSHGLVAISNINNRVQLCVAIPANAGRYEIGALLKNANLNQIPHCFYEALAKKDCESARYLHRITLPNNETLCWLLMTESGRLVEKAYCKNIRNYKLVCQNVIGFLLKKAEGRESITL